MPRYVRDHRALLAGDGLRWNARLETGAAAVVTYGYATWGDTAVTRMSAADRADVERALDLYEAACGVRFVEVDAHPSIRITARPKIYSLSLGDYAAGRAYYPKVDADGDQHVATLTMSQKYGPLDVGTYMFMAVLHELGHAMGLKHPHAGRLRLAEDVDDSDATVMSYVQTGSNATDLRAMDVEALQHLYGPSAEDLHVRWHARSGWLVLGASDADDAVTGAARNTLARLRGGDDAYAGAQRKDLALGAAGDDSLLGGGGADRLLGGGGADGLSGEGGRDHLSGGAGADRLSGGDAADALFGGAGDDRLFGGRGDDVLAGGAGSDGVHGGAGADSLVADDGFDMLDGGRGDDALTLRAGGGRLVFADGDGVDAIAGLDAATVIDLRGHAGAAAIGDAEALAAALVATGGGFRLDLGADALLFEGDLAPEAAQFLV